MKKYSQEYWLQHYEYAMGYKEKSVLDTSSAEWTKSNIDRILNNNFPHGMTGTNLIKALIKFVEIYHPKKLQDVSMLLLEYIESEQTKGTPLIKVHKYLKEKSKIINFPKMSKVTNINKKRVNPVKKNIEKKLTEKYPRITLKGEKFEILPDEKKKAWGVDLNNTCIDLRVSPQEFGYSLFSTTLLSNQIEVNLEHVIYRGLKEIYRRPALFVGYSGKTPEELLLDYDNGELNLLPIEWGWFLEVNPNTTLIELAHTVVEHGITISVWSKIEDVKKLNKKVEEFLKSFSVYAENVEKEYSIKNEKEIVKTLFGYEMKLINNIYSQKRTFAKVMIESGVAHHSSIVESMDRLYKEGKRVTAYDMQHQICVYFVSSVIFNLTSLEGFINLLYRFLLNPKYSTSEHKKSIKEGDLVLGILNLPVYCIGFKDHITPEDDIYGIVRNSLVPLRNNLIHSNITEENEDITTFEDMLFFPYNSLDQLKTKNKSNHSTSLFHYNITFSMKVFEDVDKVVHGIIEKLDAKTRKWVNKWIHSSRIQWLEGCNDFDLLCSFEWEDKNYNDII